MTSKARSSRPRRPRSDGLGITKVGLWYLAACVLVAAAATNTGNNGLFLVVALLTAALAVSHLAASANVRGLAVTLTSGVDLYANSPGRLGLTVRHRGRLLPRWLVVVTVEPEDVEPEVFPPPRRTPPVLVPRLEPKGEHRGDLEVLLRRRGPRTIRAVRVSSLFPLGLFRKGLRLPVDLEVLVYPELFDAAPPQPTRAGKSGDESSRQPGLGHELYALREYRQGDDPRGIHWKQSARQRRMIFQQRETEENRRLLIVFDNAAGEDLELSAQRRFERLVSEAATAAVDHLDAGFEVSLLTRGEHLPFAGGPRQKHGILEALARVESVPRAASPLRAPNSGSPHLRMAMDAEAPAGAAA
ncbi:MAG: DUF58 domain-containing protein [Acidobacteriota bacterium]